MSGCEWCVSIICRRNGSFQMAIICRIAPCFSKNFVRSAFLNPFICRNSFDVQVDMKYNQLQCSYAYQYTQGSKYKHNHHNNLCISNGRFVFFIVIQIFGYYSNFYNKREKTLNSYDADKIYKEFIILVSDAVVEPVSMVVKVLHSAITGSTVLTTCMYMGFTNCSHLLIFAAIKLNACSLSCPLI